MEKQSKTCLWCVGVLIVLGIGYLVLTFGESTSPAEEIIVPTSTESISMPPGASSTLTNSIVTSTVTSTLQKSSTSSKR